MSKRGLPGLLLLLAVVVGGNVAEATKPCPASRCEAPPGKLGTARCEQAAAWVAVGVASDVVHHASAPPLSKDFAEFTFTVVRWEKGAGEAGQTFRFRVGWCENRQEPPSDVPASIRVYGEKTAPGAEPRYLALERLEP